MAVVLRHWRIAPEHYRHTRNPFVCFAIQPEYTV